MKNLFFGIITAAAFLTAGSAFAIGDSTIPEDCVELIVQRPDLMQSKADPMFPAREATIVLSIFGLSKTEVDGCNGNNKASSVRNSRQKRVKNWTQVRVTHPFGQGARIFLPSTPNAAGNASREVTISAPTCLEQDGSVTSAYFAINVSISRASDGQVALLEDVANQRFPGEVQKANEQCAASRKTVQK